MFRASRNFPRVVRESLNLMLSAISRLRKIICFTKLELDPTENCQPAVAGRTRGDMAVIFDLFDFSHFRVFNDLRFFNVRRFFFV